MYWNLEYTAESYTTKGLTLTWDVLKPRPLYFWCDWFWINFNMGCIETFCTSYMHAKCFRLTLTWDVLKPDTCQLYDWEPWLTLTWDVLKLVVETGIYSRPIRLTLTWDVLKLFYNIEELRHIKINFNMGCIETSDWNAGTAWTGWLTLTWDVLKLDCSVW